MRIIPSTRRLTSSFEGAQTFIMFLIRLVTALAVVTFHSTQSKNSEALLGRKGFEIF